MANVKAVLCPLACCASGATAPICPPPSYATNIVFLISRFFHKDTGERRGHSSKLFKKKSRLDMILSVIGWLIDGMV